MIDDSLPAEASQLPEEFLKPLVKGWLAKIVKAREHKQEFTNIGKQCMGFFAGETGFMWKPEFRKILGNVKAPKFQVTMNKAFELVALFGPTLYWDNPIRSVKTRKPLELTPDVFGPAGDPNAWMIFQQAQQEQQSTLAVDKIRCQLREAYLNYTPTEQPDGGLANHAKMALTEALVKGMGILWSAPYQPAGDNRTLTGSFYDSVDFLFMDPDAETREEMQWCARERTQPVWQVEKRFKLPPGSLKDKGTSESSQSQGESQGGGMSQSDRKAGKTFDLITYYEIWSKGGVGARLTGVDLDIKETLEETVGDYAYIVVSANVDYPLNAPTDQVARAYPEEVAQMFSWPIPFWKDGRWPFTSFEFYRKPRSVWPLAPLGPGLGPLTFINFMVSRLCHHIDTAGRDFLAIAKAAASEIKSQIEKGDDLTIIELNEIHGNINTVVGFLQHPPVNVDQWKIVELMGVEFERASGLNELLYAANVGGTQSRSAADSQQKQQSSSIRPDYMARCVELAFTELARNELLCMQLFVRGQDVQPLVGKVGVYLWDQLIASQPLEQAMREMDCTIQAGSGRKPNRQRDTENINQAMQPMLPVFDRYAQGTGNFGPINGLFKMLGDAIELDTSGLQMTAPPPPDPNQPPPLDPVTQQKLQLEQVKAQTDQQKAALDMQAKQMDMQLAQVEGQLRMAEGQQKLQLEARKAEIQQQVAAMKIQADLQQTQMKMQGEQSQQGLAAQGQVVDAQLQVAKGRQDLQLQQAQGKQQMQQSQAQHKLAMKQSVEQAALKALTGEGDKK